LKEIDLRRLSAHDLSVMRTWDKERYFEPDGCEAYGCDEDDHDDACPLSSHCGEELELHGLALHCSDPTFWVRLRKLGATPAIVAEANAILHPKRSESQPRLRPSQPMCTARRRQGARPRGRRSAPARRVVSRSAGGGDPDPDEPGEARHQLHRVEDSQLAGAPA
jgi:hypothetical protein